MKQVGSKAIDLTKTILLELKQVTSNNMSLNKIIYRSYEAKK